MRAPPKAARRVTWSRRDSRSETVGWTSSRNGRASEEVPREPSPLNPCQKKTVVRVKSVLQGAELFVLCTSEERVAKDRAIREKQEQRYLAALDGLHRRIEKGRLKREIAIGEAIGLETALSPSRPLSHDHV